MSDMQERDLVRRLAGELAAEAARPEQQEKIDGWKRINQLEPQRPMLWITELPWAEFEDDVDELRCRCADEHLRSIERNLRHKLFVARRLPCDEVPEDTWWVPRVLHNADFGVAIRDQRIGQGTSSIQSHHFQPVIKDFEDLGKIRMPEVRYDEAKTLETKAMLEDLFGDALPVGITGPRRQWFNAWDQVVRWTGVTEVLTDLMDRPDYVHALMRRVTDSMLARLDQLEAQGLLGYPHPVPRVGSGAAGFTDELPRTDHNPDQLRTQDQWGGATAQIFGEVSPAMHEEFALTYEIEVMNRFGLNYYGCCEPLHRKMDLMAKVPRLRKISISTWCDVEQAAANAKQTYVFSHKPNPASLAGDRLDGQRAEEDLRRRLKQSGAMPCEIIMKDISTVRGDVQRVIDWCTMAYRVVTE